MTESRARPAPPPKKAQPFIPESQEPVKAADNMKAEKLVGMTFNMPRSWHIRFKMTATSRGLDMKDFLQECFATWERVEREKDK